METKQIHVPSKSNNFIDYSLFFKSVGDIPSKSSLLINTINQYSYCIAQKDHVFKKSLQESDILLPDGIAVVAAARFLTGQKLKKIAGADIHKHFLDDLNTRTGSCFYVGSSENTLKKIKENLAVEYPNIRVGFYSPPYKAEFDQEDNRQMIDVINAFQPEVLFVGMTAPKQEKWAHLCKEEIDTKVICTIGAVFDFYAGTVNRPSPVWVNLGLEWFMRLIHEPKRMWKRYLYYGPVFVYYMLKQKFKYRT